MQKTASKKQLILEKWEHFENGKKWPQCKGYSPCKILTSGQKLKLPKTWQKSLYKHIRVVLCKKWLQKTANIWEMGAFWKWPKMGTLQRLQPMQNNHFGSKIKNAKKGAKNDSTTTLELLCSKNLSKKQLVLEKWSHFENGRKWPQYKGYRACKILTLAQKLKMQNRCEKRFYDHIRVVVRQRRF